MTNNCGDMKIRRTNNGTRVETIRRCKVEFIVVDIISSSQTSVWQAVAMADTVIFRVVLTTVMIAGVAASDGTPLSP